MTYQQAIFVKNLIQEKTPLDKIAELFYVKFGKTVYCDGPETSSFFKGRRTNVFTNLQGNDIKSAASLALREKL
jgi:hypothetical protein